MKTPTPEEVRAARNAAKLTQTQAAALVHVSLRTWQHAESGAHPVTLSAWELFLFKTHQRVIG